MSNYRRSSFPGGTYFFTVNLLERRRRLLVARADLLCEAFRTARAARPFDVLALVMLRDHLHGVWRLPDATPIMPTAGRRSDPISAGRCPSTNVDHRGVSPAGRA